MKQYYTLTQDYIPENGGKTIGEYLDDQNIKYNVGADFNTDLKKFGYAEVFSYRVTAPSGERLVSVYRVLLDEHELTAIKLCVNGVIIIRNRLSINLMNKIRRYFSWILN